MDLNFFSQINEKEPTVEEDVVGKIFHQYDLRGKYPDQLNEGLFYSLAVAIASFLGSKKIALGRDSRNSSLVLQMALSDSLRDQGVDVVDLGMVTTPFADWVASTKKIDTLMVTASHNPADENGLKIYSRAKGGISKDNGLKEIEKKLKEILKSDNNIPKPKKRGTWQKVDFTSEYQKDIKKIIGRLNVKSVRLALDYSNGTAGLALNNILDNVGIKFTTINENPNGDFPGHSPNPLDPKTHQQLSWLLKKNKYSFGAIFDGDGDRIIFLDEKGNHVETPLIFALLADFYLPKTKPPKSVVVTASFSKIVKDTVDNLGGKTYVSPVGRTFVGPLMKAKKSLMGVERSGHYFFKDLSYKDSTDLALLKLVKIVSTSKKPLSKLIEPYNKYVTIPEINLPLKEGTQKEVFSAVREVFNGGKVSRVDGLSVEYEDWWFNLRLSNTQGLWRLSLEGSDEEFLEQKRKQLVSIIKTESKEKAA